MTDQPIRPEDIKPGDWIRFQETGVSPDTLDIVKAVSPASDPMWWVTTECGVLLALSDVLEVRRG